MVGQWPLTPRMQVRFLSPEPSIIHGSSNGRTTVSETANVGSIPKP